MAVLGFTDEEMYTLSALASALPPPARDAFLHVERYNHERRPDWKVTTR